MVPPPGSSAFLDDCFGLAQEGAGGIRVLLGAVHEQQVAVGPQVALVLDGLFLRQPQADQRGTQGGHAADQRRTFQGARQQVHDGSGSGQRAQAGHPEEGAADQDAPEPAPEGAEAAPGLHAVSRGVEAHGPVLGLVALADDGQALHVEAAPFDLAQRHLGCLAVVVNADD